MSKKNKETPSAGGRSKRDFRFDIVSLIIAFISFIVSAFTGIMANQISIRMQPLDYTVSANAQVGLITMDDNLLTTEGILFQQKKGEWSGDLSSVFLATVTGEAVDIVYVPDKMDKEFGFGHTAGERILYSIFPNNPNKLFFGPIGVSPEELNDAPQAFHLIFKGYNKEYTIYTVVFTFGGNLSSETLKDENSGESFTAGFGYLNIYVLDEDSMYNHETLQRIAYDLNTGKTEDEHFTHKDILKIISAERNLCYQKLIEVN